MAIRVGDDVFPALWACTMRLAIAFPALALLLVVLRLEWPRGDALRAACWFGFLEFGVSLPLLYWGEKVVTSGLAAVVYAISPISAMFAAKALGMEHWNGRRLAAAVCALAGVAIIFWRQLGDGGSVAGLFAVAGAATAGSVGALLLQRGPRQNAIGVNAVGALVGLPTCLIATMTLESTHPLPATATQAASVIYLAVASSVIAFGLMAWLVNHWKVTTVSFLGVIVPVIAVVLGAVFRHETFAPGALAGAAVVLIAVTFALRSEVALAS